MDERLRPAADSQPIDRAALARHLAAQGLRLDPDAPIRQFRGGLANINYLLQLDGRPVVLRRPPGGELPPGAHDMAREHRILAALAPVLPFVPDGLHLCRDRAVIGVPFQLIEYRPGLVIGGDDLGPLVGRPDAPGRLSEMLVETLTAIHAVDPQAVGLGDLGRPEGFVGRAIAGWARRSARVAAEGETARLSAEVTDWLAAQPLPPSDTVLLHNDFKLDNVILDPETLAPRAVIDWDMGTRGDRRVDLATLLSYWSEPEDPPCMHRMAQMPTAAPGFLSRAEVLARYAALTGAELSDFHVFRVLAVFRLAIVFLQLHALYASGRVEDPAYAGFDELGRDLLDFAREIARGRRA